MEMLMGNGFLSALDGFFNTCTGFLFGPVMLVVFFGTGILMTIVTKGVQFRKFGTAIKEVFSRIIAADTEKFIDRGGAR